MLDFIQSANIILRQGGIIAYPTEAVYGLGCDPFNKQAVQRILELKKRAPEKGLILIAASWDQCAKLVKPMGPKLRREMLAARGSGKGPEELDFWFDNSAKNSNKKSITWLFPASDDVPSWIRGQYDTIALRVTAHPIAKSLCEVFANPIVSTSANLEGYPPAIDITSARKYFADAIDYYVEGVIGSQANPSEIRDARTGDIIRYG